MKTADLQGALLDYYVAKAEGIKTGFENGKCAAYEVPKGRQIKVWTTYSPSTDWAQAGVLIEKYKVCLDAGDGSFTGNKTWEVHLAENAPVHANEEVTGSTPLQAICRAVVRAAFGDEVEGVDDV